jgi:hypothetical protein
MTVLTCPDCGNDQDVAIDESTYVVACQYCPAEFKIPREHRKNKKELREYRSRVNVRVGFRIKDDQMAVGWTVQSAEKGNKYLEKTSTTVDISAHPKKLHWYIAVFTCLQNIGEYKDARIWVKDKFVIDHLSGEATVSDGDVREGMRKRIAQLVTEKFYGHEFIEADHVGGDIHALIR